jgi:hypothetical protein
MQASSLAFRPHWINPTFTLAALIIGHHFAISAFCQAPSASGVSLSFGGICKPRFSSCLRAAGSFRALIAATFSPAGPLRPRSKAMPRAAIDGVSLEIPYSHDCAALPSELLGSTIRLILRGFVALK